MAGMRPERCSKCKAPVEFVYAPERGHNVPLDDTQDHLGHPLANWALYQDRRTGNWWARRVTQRVPLAPDEVAVIPHWQTCPMRVRTRELIDA